MTINKELKQNKDIYIEIGRYVHDCRVRRNFSLQHLSMRLGVNPSYLREVERGERIPDDSFIRSLSANCSLDENYIYNCLGKAPLIAREEVDQHPILQDALKEIGMSSLSEQKKNEIYQEFYLLIKKELPAQN